MSLVEQAKEAYNKIGVHQAMLVASILISGAGLKYIANDVTDNCNINFDSAMIRSIIIFSVVFVNTKNMVLSLIFTLIYNIIRDLLIGPGKICGKREDVIKNKISDLERELDEINGK